METRENINNASNDENSNIKSEKKKKEKKEKIIYVDDGRSFADMSNVTGGFSSFGHGTTSSPKDIWETYWMAVKMMFKPMLVVVGFICVIFGIGALMLLFM